MPKLPKLAPIKLHPLTHVCLLFCYCISVLAASRIAWVAAALLMAIVGLILTGRRPGLSVLRLRGIAVFALLIFVCQALFTRTGPSAIVAGYTLPITADGIASGALLALRFAAIITGSALFVAVTRPQDLAQAFTCAGIPYRYAFMLVTALRFVPFFREELNTVRNAQLARGIGLDRGGVTRVFQLARYTLIPLTLTALSKVDTLAVSMEGRCFGLYPQRSFLRPLTAGPVDVVLCAVGIVASCIAWLS